MNARTIQIAFLTASLVSCPIAVTGQAGKPDLEALDGAWNVVEIEIAGKKVVVGKGSPDKVVIKDGKISILALGKPFAIFENGDMKLDSNKKPKTIDIPISYPVLIPHRPDGKGFVTQHIASGNLVPLFSAGFSPRLFLLACGITDKIEMTAIDTSENLAGLIRQIIMREEEMPVSGFVINPTGDMRQCLAVAPVDLLEQVDPP